MFPREGAIIKFTLNSPPFSINKAYYKRSHTRTQDCRDWGDNILLQLQEPTIQSHISQLSKESVKALQLKLSYYYPSNILFTKKGDISRRSMDLSNIEKLLIDLLFDPRFCGREINSIPINNFNLDDKLITTLTSSKCVSWDAHHHIVVELQSVDAPCS